MKPETIVIASVVILGAGGVWLWSTQVPAYKPYEQPIFVSTTVEPEAPVERIEYPEETVELKKAPQPTTVVQQSAPKQQMQLAQKKGQYPKTPKVDYSRYWKQQEQRFNSLVAQLDRTTDPKQRARLLQSLAQYVRVDTLATLDFIATLDLAEEQTTALEAVNKYALTGIGARIELDGTGLPKIRQTTILSAVESTGMAAAGDYISGMVKEDGTELDFKGMPLRQIVQNLRGKPGTEIELKMERASPGGRITYSVPITRSMIVMDPKMF